MLALALIALLAAPASDDVISIPGSRLRLGMSEAQVQKLGQFTAAKGDRPGGAAAQQGETKFFGIPCKTTLLFRGDRLERVTFAATEVAPNALDYLEGQLRRSKLWRECTRYEPGFHSCDWLGTVKIHVEIQRSLLTARVEAPTRPWEDEADSTAAAPTEVAAAAPKPVPVPPEETKPATAPAEAKPTAPIVITPAQASPVAPASTPPPAERAVETVPTLPETLRLSLPERNPPSEWPRMISAPKLVYPEAARLASIQGVVWVLTFVDTDGSVRSTKVDRGIPELNAAALAWVSQARFAPCVRDGKPCRFWIRVAARFTIY
jgi:TonB family protein